MGAGGARKVRKQAASPGAGKVVSGVWGFLNSPLCAKPVWGGWSWLGGAWEGLRGQQGWGGEPAVSMMTPAVPEQGQTSGWGPGGHWGLEAWMLPHGMTCRSTWLNISLGGHGPGGVTSHLHCWRQTGARGLLKPRLCVPRQTPEHRHSGLSGFPRPGPLI